MKIDYKIFPKPVQLYTIAALGIMALTILQDKLEAGVQQFAFYFSESTLFSSFWLLFIPLLAIQLKQFQRKYLLLWILVPAAFHILIYPLLIFIISGVFLDHTFQINQTFRFAISNYLWTVVFIYSIQPLIIVFSRTKKEKKNEVETVQTLYIREANKIHSVTCSEIQYITANSPYLNIITVQRKFLHSATLRDMEKALGANFARVHKSAIVNIKFIQSMESRQNGDYDLIMKDGCSIRASRNYIAVLKEKMVTG